MIDLTEKLARMKLKFEKSLFHLKNIKDDDKSIHFNAGFPNYEILLAFLKMC